MDSPVLDLELDVEPLLALVFGTSWEDATMLRFKPGESVHLPITATVAGVLTTLGSLPAVTVIGPAGTTLTPTVTLDSQGTYHSDFVLPMASERGLWIARAQATGSLPAQNGLRERLFEVTALGTG